MRINGVNLQLAFFSFHAGLILEELWSRWFVFSGTFLSFVPLYRYTLVFLLEKSGKDFNSSSFTIKKSDTRIDCRYLYVLVHQKEYCIFFVEKRYTNKTADARRGFFANEMITRKITFPQTKKKNHVLYYQLSFLSCMSSLDVIICSIFFSSLQNTFFFRTRSK